MTIIRGATTVLKDKQEYIKKEAISLFEAILEKNPVLKNDNEILAIFASHTKDLKSFNTCTALREKFNLKCALECFSEADITGNLPLTIRLTILCNSDFIAKPVYQNNAKKLRPDLADIPSN